MDIKTLTPDFAVCPQLHPEDMKAVEALGFRSVICNRPDHEGEDQPEYAQVYRAGQEAGLDMHYLPVVAGAMTDENITDFGALIGTLAAPVLAYCRTGTRSGILWQTWMNR